MVEHLTSRRSLRPVLAQQLQQSQRPQGSYGAGHTSVLYVATVGFSPTREHTLVDVVFSSCASKVIHPDEASTCTNKQKQNSSLTHRTLKTLHSFFTSN